MECGTWPHPCWEIKELRSLKHHSLYLLLRPFIFCISIKRETSGSEAVIPSFKDLFLLKINFLSIYSFISLWHVRIGSDHNLGIS